MAVAAASLQAVSVPGNRVLHLIVFGIARTSWFRCGCNSESVGTHDAFWREPDGLVIEACCEYSFTSSARCKVGRRVSRCVTSSPDLCEPKHHVHHPMQHTVYEVSKFRPTSTSESRLHETSIAYDQNQRNKYNTSWTVARKRSDPMPGEMLGPKGQPRRCPKSQSALSLAQRVEFWIGSRRLDEMNTGVVRTRAFTRVVGV